jgi:hypothetical protein
MLNQWAQRENSPGTRSEGIRIQREAICAARAAYKAGHHFHGLLSDLLEMTFPVSQEESEECSRELSWLLSSCLNSDFEDLGKSLSEASTTCDKSLASGEWDKTSKIASDALGLVQRTLTSIDNPQEALFYIQGVSSMGAVALANVDRAAHAVELVERGATLRSRIQLQRHNRPSGTGLARATAPKRRMLPQTSGHVKSAEITGLAAAIGGPIIYLLASQITGLALIVTSTRQQIVWLPDLTSRTINHWLDLTSEGEADGTEIPIRGASGQRTPTRSAVDTVITEAATAAAPLESALTGAGYKTVHVIPIGQTAGIPWTHILSTPVTIAPSATLLDMAQSRKALTKAVISIAAPTPCHFKGAETPEMTRALEETEWLSTNLNCDKTAEGAGATRAAFHRALDSAPEILHIAVHGEVDAHSWGDDAFLLWADDPNTNEAETTTLHDLSQLKTDADTVFLAACWGGAPNRTLPDESISFPTAFLTAGAKTVIAPLWPIRDDAARDFVMAFYELWKFDGLTKAEALKQAAQEIRMRAKYRNISTWAAFMLTGNP